MAHITTIESLRRAIPPAHEMTHLKVGDQLDAQALAFLARAPFFVMATHGPDGTTEASPKGDEPGFVVAENSRTLLIPERPGNGLAFGLQNILSNGDIGLLFMAPGTGETLRVTGKATLHDDADLVARMGARGKPARLIIRVAVTKAYFHCARSVLRSGLWEPAKWPEPMKVSFGAILAEKIKANADTAALIDGAVAQSYEPSNL